MARYLRWRRGLAPAAGVEQRAHVEVAHHQIIPLVLSFAHIGSSIGDVATHLPIQRHGLLLLRSLRPATINSNLSYAHVTSAQVCSRPGAAHCRHAARARLLPACRTTYLPVYLARAQRQVRSSGLQHRAIEFHLAT